ncbi:hypothetical protein, partial [Alloprevotella tannerae]
MKKDLASRTSTMLIMIRAAALYNSTSHNGEAVLTFGKISLSGTAIPFLYFYYYALPGEAMKLKVL